MCPFGLKFSQKILHTETSKLMFNWSFLCVVLHKPTLLPSTFNNNGNNNNNNNNNDNDNDNDNDNNNIDNK